MWICAAACNERMVIAALNAIDCEPRQWMAAALTSTNSKVFGQPDWLVEFLEGADVAGQPLMEDLAEYHRHSPQEVDALMAHSGLSFADAVCPNLPRPSVLPECNDDAGQKYWLAVCWLFSRRHFTCWMNISRFVCHAGEGLTRRSANFWNQAYAITFLPQNVNIWSY